MKVSQLRPAGLVLSLMLLMAILAQLIESSGVAGPKKTVRINGQATAASVAPKTGRLLWASDQDGEWDIYVSESDGSRTRNLTKNCNSWDVSPSWLPDERIAFASSRSGKFQVYSMQSDGRELRQLTREPHGARMPRCGPNGNIAFRSLATKATFPDYRRSDLVVLQQKNRQVLLSDASIIDFAWSPDGKQIACGLEQEIVLTPLQGEPRRISIKSIDKVLYNHGAFDLQWSPDGETVACLIRFLGNRLSTETVFPGEDRLYLISHNHQVRSVPLEAAGRDKLAWVNLSPDVAAHPGRAPVDPRQEKKRVMKYFALKGFPLKEIESRGVIEYAFLVGPDQQHAIGMNILLGDVEQKAAASRLDIAIPSHVKHDIVLWNWDMKADGNSDPGFRALYERLKAALDDYPGPAMRR